MRDNTERPETVACGANIVAGTTPEGILAAALLMNAKDMIQVQHPFGDGKSGEKIIETLLRYHHFK
jgi:UDP-N-acetylglucosamine 2-epimerase (non-hydrolysing)